MVRGCPECEVSRLHQDFEEELDDELQLLAEKKELTTVGIPYTWKWSRKKLISDVAFISNADTSIDGKGYDKNWTVPMKNLVVILREEKASHRRAMDAETAKKHKEDG